MNKRIAFIAIIVAVVAIVAATIPLPAQASSNILGGPPVPPGHAGIHVYLERDGIPGQYSEEYEPDLPGREVGLIDSYGNWYFIGITNDLGIVYFPMLSDYTEVTLVVCVPNVDMCGLYPHSPLVQGDYLDIGFTMIQLWLPWIGNFPL